MLIICEIMKLRSSRPRPHRIVFVITKLGLNLLDTSVLFGIFPPEIWVSN